MLEILVNEACSQFSRPNGRCKTSSWLQLCGTSCVKQRRHHRIVRQDVRFSISRESLCDA